MARRQHITPLKDAHGHTLTQADLWAISLAQGKSGVGHVFGDLRAPAPGWVKIASDNGPMIEVMLGDAVPKITDGYGGWNAVERPRRRPVTKWDGTPPFRMEVVLLFDGFRTDTSVETPIKYLEQMGRTDSGDSEPPLVRVSLPAGTPRSPKIDWVIDSIEWADPVERRSDGKRTRQGATVTFLEFISDEVVQLSPSRKRRKAKKHKAKKPKKKGRRGHR